MTKPKYKYVFENMQEWLDEIDGEWRKLRHPSSNKVKIRYRHLNRIVELLDMVDAPRFYRQLRLIWIHDRHGIAPRERKPIRKIHLKKDQEQP